MVQPGPGAGLGLLLKPSCSLLMSLSTLLEGLETPPARSAPGSWVGWELAAMGRGWGSWSRREGAFLRLPREPVLVGDRRRLPLKPNQGSSVWFYTNRELPG